MNSFNGATDTAAPESTKYDSFVLLHFALGRKSVLFVSTLLKERQILNELKAKSRDMPFAFNKIY